jgi:hypothetical protein
MGVQVLPCCVYDAPRRHQEINGDTMSQGNWGGGGGYGPPGGAPPGGGGYGPPPGGGGYGPPPGGGGYGPPPGAGGGGYGPPPGAGGGGYGPLNPGAITERSPLTILLLSLVTCGIYFIVWKYQTTDELRLASGDESLNPGMDILLTLVSCGLWSIYASFRNAQKIHQLAQRLGVARSDQSTVVLVLGLFGLMLVNVFILQGEYNAIAQAAGRRGLPG